MTTQMPRLAGLIRTRGHQRRQKNNGAAARPPRARIRGRL